MTLEDFKPSLTELLEDDAILLVLERRKARLAYHPVSKTAKRARKAKDEKNKLLARLSADIERLTPEQAKQVLKALAVEDKEKP